MEIFSSAFFVALASIILLDLVLAGDNAIVIALAARNLPEHLRKRAIIWGSVGAVAVRSLMTLVVVWLLKIPGLLLVGGALLLWIGWRLLVPAGGGHDEDHIPAANTFFGAMKTIIIADAVMGVDNVLAVAGAAHGSYVLVVLGLLISIPIVVWGSTILLKWTERFPSIVYIGTAILVITGVKMMLNEPFVKNAWVPDNVEKGLLFAIALLVVVGGGWLKTNASKVADALRRQAKSESGSTQPNAVASAETQGETTMQKVLVAVDGSLNALEAVKQVGNEYRARGDFQVVLFNVQPRLTKHVMRFFSSAERVKFMAERAKTALAGAEAELKRLGVPYEAFFATGKRAESIADYAAKNGCARIVVGIARKNSFTRLLENSVTARLLSVTPVPVQIVAGEHASRWERLGLPIGVGSAIAALAIALD